MMCAIGNQVCTPTRLEWTFPRALRTPLRRRRARTVAASARRLSGASESQKEASCRHSGESRNPYCVTGPARQLRSADPCRRHPATPTASGRPHAGGGAGSASATARYRRDLTCANRTAEPPLAHLVATAIQRADPYRCDQRARTVGTRRVLAGRGRAAGYLSPRSRTSSGAWRHVSCRKHTCCPAGRVSSSPSRWQREFVRRVAPTLLRHRAVRACAGHA